MPFQLKIFRLLCRYPLTHQNLFAFLQTCDGIWDSEILRKDFGRILDTLVELAIGRGSSTNHNLAILEPWEDVTPYSPKTSGLDTFQHRNGRSFNHSGFKVLNCIPIFLEGWFFYTTLLKIDKCTLKRDHFRRKVVFQLSFFSGAMLVFWGVKHLIFNHKSIPKIHLQWAWWRH